MPQSSSISPSTAFQRADLPEQKDERRHLILRAAAEEIASLGKDKDFTINSLARRAGLAKGTVYLYFPSKGAIMLELLMEASDLLIADLMKDVAALPDPICARDLASVIERSFVRSDETRQFSRLFKNLSLDSSGRDQFHDHSIPRLLELDALLRKRLPQLQPGDGMELIFFSWALRLGYSAIEETKAECKPKCEPKFDPSIGLIRMVEGYLHRPDPARDAR
ncbi:MAG: TetR/AcrR family transcriptional regulator [Candidatus Methylacidiphilales bacterium]